MDDAGSPKSRVGGPSAESLSPTAAVAGHVLETGSGSSAPALIAAEQATEQDPGKKGKDVAARMRLALAVAGGAAILGAVAVVLATRGSSHPPLQVTAAPIAGALSGTEGLVDDGGADAPLDTGVDVTPAQASVWRIARLAGDPDVALVEGVVGKRSLLVALTAAGIEHGDAEVIARSLAELRTGDRVDPKETFMVARDKASGQLVAYEFASSPVDVWQGREALQADGSLKLVPRKLELSTEPFRIRKAVLVGADLRASLTEAGLAPIDDVMTMLDDALEGHAELSNIRPGSRIRIVATQERVDGVFVRWLSLDAVEYFPAAPNAPSVRVYRVGDDEGSKKHHGWYDAKGKQPFHGGWRLPVPLARIVSRFNPRRMHPVLHVVMPHNGVDLAAPAGAPVYATAAGVVTSVGFDGPCGNRVEIEHPHGISSVYCHLSRFASGLRTGQHVEQRQLVGYVGQTGRVTGPHLHFGIRRGDRFVDPMTLRLDGVRVVPRALRDQFDRLRAELDGELDAIALPAPSNVPPEATESETIYEEAP